MSEFCKECSIALFGVDNKDFAGICDPDGTAIVLCEGARSDCDGGYIIVDHEGKKVGTYGRNLPPPPSRAEHYFKCGFEGCNLWVDMRDLKAVIMHEHHDGLDVNKNLSVVEKKEIIPSDGGIDRELNPPIDFVAISVPRGRAMPSAVYVWDRAGKEIGFIESVAIYIDCRKPEFICRGIRVLRKTKNTIMVDKDGNVMTEPFECPCLLDAYDFGTNASVCFDASRNPTDRQLRDVLGCRVCGMKTSVMYRGKDGVRCSAHRGDLTEIEPQETKGLNSA